MTYNGVYRGTPISGNACTACPSGWTCAGGTSEPIKTFTLNKNGGTGYVNGTGGTSAGTITCTLTGKDFCKFPDWSSSGTTNTLTKSGYIFNGWAKSANASASDAITGSIGNQAAGTYYAIWVAPTCTATNGVCSVLTIIHNKIQARITCDTGYSVSGGTDRTSGTISTSLTGVTSISLSCSAQCNVITLNNTTNGGSGGTTTVYKKTGSTTYYSNNTCSTAITSVTKPSKTNAAYAGTYNVSSGVSGGTQCINTSGTLSTSTSCNVTGDVTWSARYNCNTNWTGGGTTIAGACTGVQRTVTFNANGGSGEMATQTFTYGKAKALTANAFSRTGYTFGGWNTAADGSGTAYADKASITKLTSNITLYAQWFRSTVTFTYYDYDKGNYLGTTTCSGTDACYLGCANSTSSCTASAVSKPGYKIIEFILEGDDLDGEVMGNDFVLSDNLSGVANNYVLKYGNATWTVSVSVVFEQCAAGTYSNTSNNTCAACSGVSFTDSGSDTETITGGTRTRTKSRTCYRTTSAAGSTASSACTGSGNCGSYTYGTWVATCNSGYSKSSDGTTCVANTITLKWANGGHGTAPTTPATCTYGSSFTVASGMSATGYTFGGWKSSKKTLTAGASVTCNYDNLGVYSGTATLTGQWTIKSVKCNPGTYLKAGGTTTSDCATCPQSTTSNSSTVGTYCPGGTFNYNASSNQGLNACPVLSDSTAMQSASYPNNDDGGTASLTSRNISAWYTGQDDISDCLASYYFSNSAGAFTLEGVHYSSTSGRYDNGGGKYYTTLKPGYYLTAKYSDTYCDTSVSNYANRKKLYRTAKKCTAGSYCPGYSSGVPLCSSTNETYDTNMGIKSCPSPYSSSAAGSDAQTDCYLTTSAGSYVKAQKGAQVTCDEGGYCPGNVTVYYNSIGGRTLCACGTYNASTGSSASTACKKTDAGYYSAAGAASQTKSSAGYVAAAGACSQTQCTGATYSAGGQATCTACPDGYTYNTTSGKTAQTSCQIQCSAGTRVATANAKCTSPAGGWYTSGATVANYGNVTAVNYCMAGYTNSGTTAADHNEKADCKQTVTNASVASSIPARYVRLTTSGNNKAGKTHVKEIQAFATGTDPWNGSPTNLLSGKSGTGSVTGYPASNATDGNTTTYAETTGYLTWDMGSQYNLGYIRLLMYNDGRTYSNVKIEVSTDNSTWTTVFLSDVTSPKNATTGEMIVLSGAPIACATGYSSASSTVTLGGTKSCSANTYTVTYACGSGASGTAPSNATATYDSTFTPSANTCTKTGYNFAGWTTPNNSGTTVTHAAGTGFKWQYTANKTFTAKWTIISKTCSAGTYLAKGGTTSCTTCPAGYYCPGGTFNYNASSDQGKNACNSGKYQDTTGQSTCKTCDAGSVTATSGAYTKCSNCFYGKYQDATGQTTCKTCGANTYTTTTDAPNASCTSCASGYSSAAGASSCTGNTITLSWANGGRGTVPTGAPSSCTYGSSFTVASGMSSTGYTFGGWKSSKKTLTAGASVTCNYDNLGVYSGTATLTGQWTANTYTVTLDSKYYASSNDTNGTAATTDASPTTLYLKFGTGWYSDSTLQTKITKLTKIPTYTGYVFGGFLTHKPGVGGNAINASGEITGSNTYLTSDWTLYANWTPVQRTVTFNANGGSGSMSTQTFTYGTAKNLTANTFTRTGYTFKNWNTKSDGSGTTYTDKASISTLLEDTTLYAQWTVKCYEVELEYSNNGSIDYDYFYMRYDDPTKLYQNDTCSGQYVTTVPNVGSDDNGSFGGYYDSVLSKYCTDSKGNLTGNCSVSSDWPGWSAEYVCNAGYVRNGEEVWAGDVCTANCNPILLYIADGDDGYTEDYVYMLTGDVTNTVYSDNQCKTAVTKLDNKFKGVTEHSDFDGFYETNDYEIQCVDKNLNITGDCSWEMINEWDSKYICHTGYYNFANDDVWGVSGDPCTPNTYSCDSGYYLDGTECVLCDGDSWCPGVTDQLYDGGVHGLNSCPSGYTFNTDTGKSSQSQCTIQCPTGLRVANPGEQCTTPAGDWYKQGNDEVKYGDVSAVNYCMKGYNIYPAGTTSRNYHATAANCIRDIKAGQCVVSQTGRARYYKIESSGIQKIGYDDIEPATAVSEIAAYRVTSNVLVRKVATTNGTLYGDAKSATDGTPSASSIVVGENGYLMWDSGQSTQPSQVVKSIEFAMAYGYIHHDVKVSISTDGTTWTTVFEADKIIAADPSAGMSEVVISSEPTTCVAGKYSIAGKVSVGVAYGRDCAKGSYSAAGASACIACQDGLTTSGTTKSSCDTSCTNTTGVSDWVSATWTGNAGTNSVENSCTIESCATGYTLSENTCVANTYKITYSCGDGGTSNSQAGFVQETEATYDSSFVVQNNEANQYGSPCTKTGYTMTGWVVSGETSVLTPGETIDRWNYVGDKTLTAQWTANTNTVKIYMEENSEAVFTTINAIYDSVVPTISLSKPTKTGYTFAGIYNTYQSGESYYYDSDMKPITSNLYNVPHGGVPMYIKWTPVERTVTFNKNGGSGEMSTQTFTYDVAQNLRTNTFTRTGYTFKNWNTAANGTGTTYADKASISTLLEDTILYAQWTANEIIIDYDENDADSISNGSCTYDENFTTPNISRTGYTFDGWQLADGTVVNAGDTVKCISTTLGTDSGTTGAIKALWTANTYYVRYNQNKPKGTQGKVNGTMVNSSHTYDKGSPLSKNAYSLTGYTFDGWFTTAGNQKLGDEAKVWRLTSKLNAVVDLDAQWIANTYTVAFDGNDETSGKMSNQDRTYDDNVALPANAFTKTGYTFDGWSVTQNGELKFANQSTENVTSENGATVTLYARWKADCNAITIKSGCNGVSDKVIYKETDKPGWFIDSQCEQPLTQFTETIACDGMEYRGIYSTNVAVLRENGNTGIQYFTKSGIPTNTGIDSIVNQPQTVYVAWAEVCRVPDNGSCKLTVLDNGGVDYSASCVPGYTLERNGIYNPVCIQDIYKITLNKSGGTGGLDSKDCFYGDCELPEYDATTYNITKSGHIFMGWSGTKNGTVIPSGKIFATGDATYYAVWQPCQECNAGVGTTCSFAGVVNNECTYDTACKIGYSSLVNAGKYNPECSVTFYTITYDANVPDSAVTDVIGEMQSSRHVYNTERNLNANQYKLTGWVFTGWNTSADGKGNSYSDAQSVLNLTTENNSIIPLYAQWRRGTKTCVAGKYLNGSTEDCELCELGMVCPGIESVETGYGENIGLYECPENSTAYGYGNISCTCANTLSVEYGTAYVDQDTIQWDEQCTYNFGISVTGNPCKIENNICVETSCKSEYEMISGKCHACDRENALTYHETGNCLVKTCAYGYHPIDDQCLGDIADCISDDDKAVSAQRAWDFNTNAFGECIITECEYGYHIENNECLLDERSCEVPNGVGEQVYDEKYHKWGDCVATKCNRGYTTDHTLTNERWEQCGRCNNMYGAGGELVVKSYSEECIIELCYDQGEKYILENNECRLICADRSDDTGIQYWDNGRCVQKCNPGYIKWQE